VSLYVFRRSATAIQLALLPLAAKGLLKTDVHINATTVTGVSPSETIISAGDQITCRITKHSTTSI
jgi:N-acetyl-gamma-glutamyl-phosphate reductase